VKPENETTKALTQIDVWTSSEMVVLDDLRQIPEFTALVSGPVEASAPVTSIKKGFSGVEADRAAITQTATRISALWERNNAAETHIAIGGEFKCLHDRIDASERPGCPIKITRADSNALTLLSPIAWLGGNGG
jgi:hypothetical protein